MVVGGRLMMACLIGEDPRLLPIDAFDAVFERLPAGGEASQTEPEPSQPKPKRVKRAMAEAADSPKLIDQVRAAISGQARSTIEIGNVIGFLGEGKARQPLYDAIYRLKQKGAVARIEDPSDGTVRWLLKEGA